MPSLERQLAFRIAAGVCAGAGAILLVAGALNLERQRAQLTRLTALSADRIAETIRRSTQDAMLRDDREGLHRMIANIGAQPGIARIRVFNKDGMIRTSTDAAEVGRLVNKSAEECYACHQRDRPLAQLPRADRVRIFRAPSAGRVLGIIAPIHNETQCAACHVHPASQRVLGVLDVQLSLDAVDEAVTASERQMLAGLVATVAAVLLLGGFLVWTMVLRPVRRLTRGMARVASGDLATTIPVTSADEIGEMTASWNTMTAELGRAREELYAANRTLEERVARKSAELDRAHQQMFHVEKMASLGKLAAVVAHEINNPLAGIRTYARLLRRRVAEAAVRVEPAAPPASGAGGDGRGETDRILEVIDSEAGRCGDIVRNLLLFSRSQPARFAPGDLGPLLERCRLLLRHQAEMLGVELTVETTAELPRIVCDGAQVEQALLALAMNGLEATPSGGRVTLSARAEEGGGVVLVVSDTGCGIPAEIRERIFEPFVTTKEQGKGVGLGLAVVYGIVTRHGGRIDVESRAGGGTVFTMHLPERPPDPAGGLEAP